MHPTALRKTRTTLREAIATRFRECGKSKHEQSQQRPKHHAALTADVTAISMPSPRLQNEAEQDA
jgi:hypothetical protein